MKAVNILASRKNEISVSASLMVHACFISFFLMLPALPQSNIQTFLINFEQPQENQVSTSASPPVQAVAKHREIAQPKIQAPPRQPVQRNSNVIAKQQPDNVPAVLAQESQLPPVKANVVSAAPAAPLKQGNEKGTNSGVLDAKFGEGNAPRFLHRELPVYPQRAQRLGQEGKVVLKLFIDHTGRLLDVTVIETGAYGFTEAAINAIKRSTFVPARINGQSVASRAIINIRFHLLSE
ncbi:MAG: energy transducer TonB [Smithella sp.]